MVISRVIQTVFARDEFSDGNQCSVDVSQCIYNALKDIQQLNTLNCEEIEVYVFFYCF